MSTPEIAHGADLFSTSAQRVVDYLNAHTPIPDWSISRVAGGEQVHLHVHAEELLALGLRVPWDDTFCVRMSRGAAHIVPDAQADADYADHPEAQVVRSYVGFPLTDDEGNTFGTLCGVGSTPLDGVDDIDAELVTVLRDLLSSQLTLARMADRERRAAEVTAAVAQTDALTGLINRRGWDLLIDDAEERITAYGDPVAVAVIDLDGLKLLNDTKGHTAGDELLRRAADVLGSVAQTGDRVARFGGDEFTILSNDVPVPRLQAHFARFADALAEQGIEASIGFAATKVGVVGIAEAFHEADALMYRSKAARKKAG